MQARVRRVASKAGGAIRPHVANAAPVRLAVAGGAAAGLLGLVARRRRASLRDQVAVVTGGSRGLGLLIARELAAQGCRLAICGRDPDALERARADLAGRGAKVLAVPCDVADRSQVEAFVARTVQAYGGLDILVNNAGTILVGPVDAAAVADFEDAMGAMFWGTVYATMAALAHLRAARPGRIVNITSIGGRVSVPHLVPYSCAKFAAVGFSDGLRAELAPQGIRVTTVVPGLMRTGSHLHARFAGRPPREFAWFSLLAGAPLLSMDGERAARRIVDGLRRGRPQLTLTPAAQVATRLSGALPTLTGRLVAASARLLPSARPPSGTAEGSQVQESIGRTALRRLTTLNLSAAGRFNQVPPDRHQHKERAPGGR
ncbi:MAG: SDR family oxidoreductase [Micromonosporaceae bacterium]|jgi:NAD(P)-dependent dehydrogenase (short-subunit alcohol dehydrogenase family)|nr:SDR family oxidoreductase [Micromonosporaceae bacterium]